MKSMVIPQETASGSYMSLLCLRWFVYFPNGKSTRNGESILLFLHIFFVGPLKQIQDVLTTNWDVHCEEYQVWFSCFGGTDGFDGYRHPRTKHLPHHCISLFEWMWMVGPPGLFFGHMGLTENSILQIVIIIHGKSSFSL
jgi:hypothetical protein